MMPLPKEIESMMELPLSVWTGTSPRTLFDCCAAEIRENPYIACRLVDGQLCLRHPLPPEVAEELLADGCAWEISKYVAFLELLNECPSSQPNGVLRRFVAAFPNIPEAVIIKVIKRHKLTHLCLDGCVDLSPRVYEAICEHGDELVSVNFGSAAESALPTKCWSALPPPVSGSKWRRLIWRNFDTCIASGRPYSVLIGKLTELRHLELSNCSYPGPMKFLSSFTNLTTLVLHSVRPNRSQGLILLPKPEMFSVICGLKNLRFLDISESQETEYPNPDETLAELVESLPKLECLDISHTNLAGTGRARCKRLGSGLVTDIVGLRSRTERPLKFLGLYGTLHDACRRHHIPADIVSGDANEEQVLAAGEAYIERQELMKYVLNDIFNMFRVDTVSDVKRVLDIILRAMHKYLNVESIQISGSASLYHIVKHWPKNMYPTAVTQRILRTLVNGMVVHQKNGNMMRNGCLTLWNFEIPKDVLFDYERIVTVLLSVVDDENRKQQSRNNFVHRMCVFLLNAFACQVEGYHKNLLGKRGAIRVMLDLIHDRLHEKNCDDVMEMAWSSMWNVTDETPENCREFLSLGGMQTFLDCCHVFEGREELLRNMMGLLGNVAEVKELRPQLMNQTFIGLFDVLLDSPSDGIEVSYNAAGVLAHIASDGEEAWTLQNPDRRGVLSRLVRAVDRWDLDKQRNINYRSFEPILRLVKVQHTEEVRYWAVWALANLTTVYPGKYCGLVREEGGLEILAEVIKLPTRLKAMRSWAHCVLHNCATTPYPYPSQLEEED